MPPRLQLTIEEIENMKAEFLKLDVDGDGTITIDELSTILQSMKMELDISEDDIERTLNDIDRDGDGTIGIEEFVESRKHKSNKDLLHRALLIRKRIRKVFDQFDLDQNGYITNKELAAAIETRTGLTVKPEHIEKIIKDVDHDNDGRINFEEFVVLMTR